MFARLLATALASGVLAGILISLVQEITTTPLIIQAERFESLGANAVPANAISWNSSGVGGSIRLVHVGESHGSTGGDGEGSGVWQPEEGIERSFYTVLSNIVAGVAFAALLVAAFGLSKTRITPRSGIVWGLAGFTVFAAAPSLGLPPEVPGALAAEIGARQSWWALAAASTAAGLWLLVFRSRVVLHILGVALLALPHLIGAPHPEIVGGSVPPELAAQFAAASLVTSLVFWAILGWLAGKLYGRFVSSEPVAA